MPSSVNRDKSFLFQALTVEPNLQQAKALLVEGCFRVKESTIEIRFYNNVARLIRAGNVLIFGRYMHLLA